MPGIVLASMVVVANVTGAVMVVPQVLRLRRQRTVDGVSPAWAGVGLALNSWWVLYGWAQGVWAVVPVTAVGAALYLAIAWQYGRLAGTGSWSAVVGGAASATAAPIIVLATAGWGAVGVTLGLSYALQFSPALWTAARADRLAGLSTGTWWLAWAEAVVWFAYGAAVGEPALVIGGGGGATMAGAIILCLARHRTSLDGAAAVGA